MFYKLPDDSIRDDKGKLLYFSIDRFLRDIREGDCCFICGSSRNSVEFNDEHVLPQWILRRYKLFDKKIVLPNRKGFSYGNYTVPCCKACNSDMASIFETPLSKVTAEGYDATIEYAKSGGMMDLFVWLTLIFLKVHLKDRDLRLNLDQRLGASKLSDLHPWADLHHLHCVARSFYTHCEIDIKILGSIAILPAKLHPDFEAFDFCDLSVAQTMLLRLGEVAFIAVLNDSCAALNVLSGALGSLATPLTPMQLRELTAHFATVNLNLVHRPKFSSQFKPKEGRYVISAEAPEKLQIGSASRSQFGEVFYRLLIGDWLPAINSTEIEEAVRQGRYTFFDPPLGL